MLFYYTQVIFYFTKGKFSSSSSSKYAAIENLSELRRAIAAAILKRVQASFEAIQRRGLNQAVGQLVPMFCHLVREEFMSYRYEMTKIVS